LTAGPEAAATAAAPPPLNDARYASFAELRSAHLDLRASFSETVHTGGTTGAADQLRQFLAKAQKTGAVLVEPTVRKAAQGILDYWCAELAGLPDATKEDFIPLTLAPPAISTLSDVEQTAGEGEQGAQRKEDQRALIRLSGMARQWRNAGRQPGYLLTGTALEEARPFAQQDADFLEFIEASEAAEAARKAAEERRAKRRSKVRWSIALVAAGLISVWYFGFLAKFLAKLAAKLIALGIAQGTVDSARALHWLDLIQLFSPPYDLSGSQKFANVDLPKLVLSAPNFSGVEFSGVKFPYARLPAASFSGGDFSFDGSAGNDFSGAELPRAQFRNSRIASTSFVGADLYRAVFDRAVLCNVDFSQANLRYASFWSVTLDAPTTENLKNTAWWQAVGWSWSDIQSLAKPRAGAPAGSRDRAVNLKKSSGFKSDIKVPIEKLSGIALSPLERAVALNDLAWTDAVWGVDTVPPNGDQTAPKPATAPDPCAATGIPDNAPDAAEQAVCIVGNLNREGDKKGTYTDLLSNLRDTLAYIRLQNNELPDALNQYRDIASDNSKFLENPDVSFRYAIALHADAKNDADKAAAVKRFTDAIDVKRYQPTHELQNLRDLISPFKEFTDVLEGSNNKLWPQIQYRKAPDQPGPVRPVCPAPKPAAAR
jgi:hypothetical protein